MSFNKMGRVERPVFTGSSAQPLPHGLSKNGSIDWRELCINMYKYLILGQTSIAQLFSGKAQEPTMTLLKFIQS